jgi:hypothetical protein
MVAVAVEDGYSDILRTHPNFSAVLKVGDGDDSAHKKALQVINNYRYESI